MKTAKRWLALTLFLCICAVLLGPIAYAAKSNWEGYPYDPGNEYFRYYGRHLTQGSTRDEEVKETGTMIRRLGINIDAWDPIKNKHGETLEEDTITYTIKNIPTGDKWKAILFNKVERNISTELGMYELNFTEDVFFGSSSDCYSTYEKLKENVLNDSWEVEDKTEKHVYETTIFGYPAIVDKYTYLDSYYSSQTHKEYTKYYIVINAIDLPFSSSTPHLVIAFSSLASVYLRTNPDLQHGAALMDDVRSKMNTVINDFINTGSITVERDVNILIDNYKPGAGMSLIKNTDASDKAGETDVRIPEALAIAIMGGAAAMAGAGGGAGSGSNSDEGDKKKKSRYKMCLRKDFGDAIRYDRQPVTVYARIVEITSDGEEIDRPDLTASLEIFSEADLTVVDCSMVGNYMAALVSAKSVAGEQSSYSGVLSIRFSGTEGYFQNNVTFRLVSKPYISFPEQGSHLTMTLPMLLGDGKLYETPFILHDFMEKPTSVQLDVAEGVPFECELEELENLEAVEEANGQRYILKVKNLSAKPEGQQALKQVFGIGVLAGNDKEKAENSLNVELYPEGLSIREVKFDDQGYVLINTFDNEATDEWGDVLPTGFVLDFAVAEQGENQKPGVRVLEPQEFSPVFNDLKGTDKRTSHLAERFKYSIKEIQSNLKEYKFAPEEALVEEEGKPYLMTLPISCSYGQEEYTLDLPIRLLGGGPGPLAGWDEAFVNMKKVVSKVGGISPEIAKMLRENGKKMSTAELRLVTRKICHDAIIYYTKDADEYKKIAEELDNMHYYADWLKWFGDQAFSYLISTYYGSTADAILSPAKDVFAALLGEIIDYLLSGEEITIEELETVKNITAAVDNLITNAFDDAMGKEKISFKQICGVVAGFLVWKIAKNIYENRDQDGKIDLYSAITALTADFTAMGVKKIAGDFFDKALKNTAVQNALNKPIGKWIRNIVPNIFKGRWDVDKAGEHLFKIIEFKKSDIIKKYLEEGLGALAVKVVELGAEDVQGLHTIINDRIASSVELIAWPRISLVNEFTDQNGQKTAYQISFTLGLDAIGKFFDYLFGELFGEVPFATETKLPPIDPPYFPGNNLDTV